MCGVSAAISRHIPRRSASPSTERFSLNPSPAQACEGEHAGALFVVDLNYFPGGGAHKFPDVAAALAAVVRRRWKERSKPEWAV